jgi:hypothetical protein
MLLFYYDHNLSSLTAQAKQFPLKKPGGFHWDFFLLGITTIISAILGLPYPNGLVPQAPVHTDACTNYETSLQLISTSETDSSGEHILIRKAVLAPTSVHEQRLTHFLMSLLLIGTMTGPLLLVLATIPRALFAGVFFVVGWGSVESNGITHKLMFLLREHRFIDPQEPLRQIMHYVFWQLWGVFASVAISQTIAAIGFPVIIMALIPLRWLLLPKLLKPLELKIMDDLTASSEVVLASLGGRPRMEWEDKDEDGKASAPRGGDAEAGVSSCDGGNREDENLSNARLRRTGSRMSESEKEWVDRREGIKKQRVGSYHR